MAVKKWDLAPAVASFLVKAKKLRGRPASVGGEPWRKGQMRRPCDFASLQGVQAAHDAQQNSEDRPLLAWCPYLSVVERKDVMRFRSSSPFRVSHSQIIRISHPSCFSLSSFARSRAVFRWIFWTQYFVLVSGVRAPSLHECRCQKHPRTSMIFRSRGKTKSGRVPPNACGERCGFGGAQPPSSRFLPPTQNVEEPDFFQTDRSHNPVP
jgi:hypothetical protein